MLAISIGIFDSFRFLRDFLKKVGFMKVGAVICEFNPFHRGHAYLLARAKEACDAVVCLMSGSYTQRGEAAVLSKYERAATAVAGGADLVLELPFPFCASRADRFAAGGVALADALGLVDMLIFGSECGDLDALRQAARLEESDAFAAALAEALAEGQNVSYRAAWDAAARRARGDGAGALGSNDRLGVAYLREMQKGRASFAPATFRRQGEAFDGAAASPDGERYAAASTVRRLIEEGKLDEACACLPDASADALRKAADAGRMADGNGWFPLIAASLRSSTLTLSGDVPDLTEELAARIGSAAHDATSFERFLSLAETRRYSRSRIRRVLLAAFFGVKEADFTAVRFTNVLAANETGRAVLAQARKTATAPILTKPSDYKAFDADVCRAAELNARADAVWELLCASPRNGGAMLRERPVMLGR